MGRLESITIYIKQQKMQPSMLHEKTGKKQKTKDKTNNNNNTHSHHPSLTHHKMRSK